MQPFILLVFSYVNGFLFRCGAGNAVSRYAGKTSEACKQAQNNCRGFDSLPLAEVTQWLEYCWIKRILHRQWNASNRRGSTPHRKDLLGLCTNGGNRKCPAEERTSLSSAASRLPAADEIAPAPVLSHRARSLDSHRTISRAAQRRPRKPGADISGESQIKKETRYCL